MTNQELIEYLDVEIDKARTDCGDNSCRFSQFKNKGGMRTNDGCRCGRNQGDNVARLALRFEHAYNSLKDIVKDIK